MQVYNKILELYEQLSVMDVLPQKQSILFILLFHLSIPLFILLHQLSKHFVCCVLLQHTHIESLSQDISVQVVQGDALNGSLNQQLELIFIRDLLLLS
jgi:hypothetical protein